MKIREINNFLRLLLPILAVVVSGCTNNGKNGVKPAQTGNAIMDYAQFYAIEDTLGDIKTISVRNLWSGAEKIDKYTLVPRDSISLLEGDEWAIPYPVKNVVCMSSSHVALMASLNEHESISAISGTGFITNEKVRELIAEGKIADIGTEELPNYEKIISLKPDVVIAYGIAGNSNSYIENLKRYGIKVLTIGEYLENDPLGKLEYIKLFGLLTEKEQMADSIYSSVCRQYLQTKEKVAGTIGNDAARTKVLINAPYKGTWMIPGQENYISRLIWDAGGMILGSKEGKSLSSQMSFEQIYQIALQADIWLHTNAINTMNELANENPLYKNIPSFQQGKVYNNTLITSNGGSAFWETGIVEPHKILQDLATLLHPELFKDTGKLNYYIQLM